MGPHLEVGWLNTIKSYSREEEGTKGAKMGRKKKEEKPKWKFFWKNVGPLGMLWRIALGIGLVMAARNMKDDTTKSMAMTIAGVFVAIEGLMRWCSLRAIFRRPTKRAFLRHYPETAE